MSKAFKKYVCRSCGAEHYIGTSMTLNGVECGDCGDEINEEEFEQVEVYEGKIERGKKPVETFDTVERWSDLDD